MNGRVSSQHDSIDNLTDYKPSELDIYVCGIWELAVKLDIDEAIMYQSRLIIDETLLRLDITMEPGVF